MTVITFSRDCFENYNQYVQKFFRYSKVTYYDLIFEVTRYGPPVVPTLREKRLIKTSSVRPVV